MADLQAVKMTQVIEIRARRDRNRLLATFDPVTKILRLFNRGQVLTVQLDELTDCELSNKNEVD